jgi:hypothetical protein
MNDDINWSLSFYPNPSTYNMFYVILHEIGHSLGLNHVLDQKSIMFPAYINKSYDSFNFTFGSDSVDEKLIKTMYSKYHIISTSTSTTTLSTIKQTEPNDTKSTTQTTSVISTTSKIETEDFYPDFSLCKQNDEVDWCNDDLIFNLIYDIEGYLFLYKSIDFWMYTDSSGIKTRKFNHYNYWNNIELPGLISIIQIDKDFVLFYETFAQILSCDKGEMNLNYSRVNITNRVHGLFYNHTSDTLYLFSKETPKTYYKVINLRTNDPRTSIKPISLFKMDIFDYDLVFSRNNIVYFVKRNIIDYYDFALNISVKGIEFKDLFLRDQCKILPLAKNLVYVPFKSKLI